MTNEPRKMVARHNLKPLLDRLYGVSGRRHDIDLLVIGGREEAERVRDAIIRAVVRYYRERAKWS